VLELLCRSHAVAGLDEPREVLVEGVVGEPGQRGLLGGAVAAARQRDAEDVGDDDGVLLERLVEVAHAEEEDGAGVAVLDLPVLPHQRRLLRAPPRLLVLDKEVRLFPGHRLRSPHSPQNTRARRPRRGSGRGGGGAAGLLPLARRGAGPGAVDGRVARGEVADGRVAGRERAGARRRAGRAGRARHLDDAAADAVAGVAAGLRREVVLARVDDDGLADDAALALERDDGVEERARRATVGAGLDVAEVADVALPDGVGGGAVGAAEGGEVLAGGAAGRAVGAGAAVAVLVD